MFPSVTMMHGIPQKPMGLISLCRFSGLDQYLKLEKVYLTNLPTVLWQEGRLREALLLGKLAAPKWNPCASADQFACVPLATTVAARDIHQRTCVSNFGRCRTCLLSWGAYLPLFYLYASAHVGRRECNAEGRGKRRRDGGHGLGPLVAHGIPDPASHHRAVLFRAGGRGTFGGRDDYRRGGSHSAPLSPVFIAPEAPSRRSRAGIGREDCRRSPLCRVIPML